MRQCDINNCTEPATHEFHVHAPWIGIDGADGRCDRHAHEDRRILANLPTRPDYEVMSLRSIEPAQRVWIGPGHGIEVTDYVRNLTIREAVDSPSGSPSGG